MPAEQRSHSYFVGRRKSHTVEVYEVTATTVERLRPRRSRAGLSLDWRAGDLARMELGRVLISRTSSRRPSLDLQARFALYVLGRLPESGFVLDADDVARWLRVAGDTQIAHE
jgi:hypothetical protein